MGEAVQTKGESSAVTVDAALDWIRSKAGGERPLFAVVWFGSPHNPHRAIEQDRALYAAEPAGRQHFYGEITGMDRAFGKLRDSLSELGIRDNTLLWYCSDNGGLPRLGATGGRGHKGQVYEGGLRVPAILEWPAKVPRPRTIQARSSTCDIYPTLLEIAGAGVENQPPLDGVSLVPIIEGRAEKVDRPIGFWNYRIAGIRTPTAQWMAELLEAQQAGGDLPPHEVSVRAAELPNPAYPLDKFPGHAAWIAGDWKLHRIEAPSAKVSWELYNLAVDPLESHDLAASEQPRVTAMRTQLEAWLKSVVRSLNGADYAKR